MIPLAISAIAGGLVSALAAHLSGCGVAWTLVAYMAAGNVSTMLMALLIASQERPETAPDQGAAR